jgi:transcriptional regulator with XRE-family HTH domain
MAERRTATAATGSWTDPDGFRAPAGEVHAWLPGTNQTLCGLPIKRQGLLRFSHIEWADAQPTTGRRAKITPEQSGLPVYGANRRVAGLRREEVAVLAGISVEYYTRLERGNVGDVSESVLDGVAHALQLDEAERDHLFRLVRSAATRRAPRRAPGRKRVRPTIQRMLDLMPMPAYLRNGRFDILAANDLGRALYSPLYEESDTPNSSRFVFLSPAAPEFFLDFDKVQDDAVEPRPARSTGTAPCPTTS